MIVTKITKPGLLALFGSGELSPTGRKIHEYLVKNHEIPVKIALLETPAGYEANPHHWYQKLEAMLRVGLQNYKPIISRVPALRCDGDLSTNNLAALKPLLTAHYIHAGAGSPSYAAKHLHNSLALTYLKQQLLSGASISFASAAAIAMGRYTLPVYEIFSAGEDLHWKEGLDFLNNWGLNLTIIPHWNNTEGGQDIDTRFCYMGEKRFNQLVKLLPEPTTILGIDEQTACIFDFGKNEGMVMGTGMITIKQGSQEKHFSAGNNFSLEELRIG